MIVIQEDCHSGASHTSLMVSIRSIITQEHPHSGALLRSTIQEHQCQELVMSIITYIIQEQSSASGASLINISMSIMSITQVHSYSAGASIRSCCHSGASHTGASLLKGHHSAALLRNIMPITQVHYSGATLINQEHN